MMQQISNFTADAVREKVANGHHSEKDASEVADLVVYLTSDQASFITGTILILTAVWPLVNYIFK